MKKILIQPTNLLLIVFLFCFLLSANAGTSNLPSDTSLYSHLGGKDGITRLIDEAIANLVSDRRINMRFARADVNNLKKDWNNIICNRSGSNCDLPVISKKIKVTDTEWKAGIEDISAALDKFRVPDPEKSQILATINALRKDYFIQ